MWKETFKAYSKVIFQYLPEETEKNNEKPVRV
jgi:hypothetical protein